MAYIKTEEVKEIREKFKKEFPTKEGWKFSIVREHYSSVNVFIMKAPYDLMIDNDGCGRGITEYHYKETYPKELAKKFELMFKIMRTENYFDKSDSMSDYFHVSHYYNLHVGKWDKVFEQSK